MDTWPIHHAHATSGLDVVVFIRPENLRIHRRPLDVPNLFECRVEDTSFLGEHLHCRVDAGGRSLVARQHPSAQLEVGELVYLEMPPTDLTIIGE